MSQKPALVGWFDSPEQTTPTYDPPYDSPCPVCNAPVIPGNVTTISFRMNDERSYFYRTHRACYAGLSDEQRVDLDETMNMMAKGVQ